MDHTTFFHTNKSEQISSGINTNEIIPEHLIIKLLKTNDKKNNHKTEGEKTHNTVDFSSEILEAKRK